MIRVYSTFGAFEKKSYHEIIWLQILKTFREEKNAFRKLLRCEGGGSMAGAWALERRRRLLLHHHRDGRMIWTEPVKS